MTTLTEDMSNTITDLRRNGTATATAAAEAAQDGLATVAAQSRKAVSQAARKTAKRLATAKDDVLDRSAAVAQSLHAMADEDLRGTIPGRMIEAVADGVTDAALAMREQDLRGIVASTTDFARRNPVLFVAGVALAGFAVVRLARAASAPTTKPRSAARLPGAAAKAAQTAPKPRAKPATRRAAPSRAAT
jgi:hypothetical protein